MPLPQVLRPVRGADYLESRGMLTWGHGDTDTKFIDDTVIESDETVNLTLSNPDAEAALGTPSTAVLTVAAQ
jgi:hypothetical protein